MCNGTLGFMVFNFHGGLPLLLSLLFMVLFYNKMFIFSCVLLLIALVMLVFWCRACCLCFVFWCRWYIHCFVSFESFFWFVEKFFWCTRGVCRDATSSLGKVKVGLVTGDHKWLLAPGVLYFILFSQGLVPNNHRISHQYGLARLPNKAIFSRVGGVCVTSKDLCHFFGSDPFMSPGHSHLQQLRLEVVHHLVVVSASDAIDGGEERLSSKVKTLMLMFISLGFSYL